jgi:hypothetical protein
MIHIADPPKNRAFDPFSGRFAPIRPTKERAGVGCCSSSCLRCEILLHCTERLSNRVASGATSASRHQAGEWLIDTRSGAP